MLQYNYYLIIGAANILIAENADGLPIVVFNEFEEEVGRLFERRKHSCQMSESGM